MKEICRSFQIEVEVLTPIHIGSGEGKLAYDYDFGMDRGQVWVIDQTKMLSRLSDEELEAKIDAKISHVLRTGQYRDSARYALVIPGQSAPQEIYPCVKDVGDRPYIPGSTLKGAIRTAIAWEQYSNAATAVESTTRTQTLPGRRENPKFAASQLERSLFGPDPNRDIMRALSIADCTGLNARPSLSCVSLLTLRGDSLVPKGQGYRFFLETIPAGTRLSGSLRIDEFLFGPRAGRAEIASKRSWIEGFDRACRSFSTATLSHEIEFYSENRHSRATREYERLRQVNRSLGEGEFLLQIGWGTGWQSKTVGTRISEPSLSALVRRFNLDRGRGHAIFPKTRRLVEVDGAPAVPLGWLKVTMKGESPK